ncbi:MAG: YafY family transcriptional regulator [Anaerolineae bacterium]|nr:YafY family transcriptional regulator [Anaerolineae bacterium]
MNRFERMFGILLRLHADNPVSAPALAAAFGVSTRTIYRDIDVLCASGVPIYAEQGRDGGFKLLEDYFLPPLMFTREEGIVLLTSLTLLRSLPVKPFSGEIEAVTHKLLSALPDRLRGILANADRLIGFEHLPHDIFHPETNVAAEAETSPRAVTVAQVIDVALRGILEGRSLSMEYRAPHRAVKTTQLRPVGLFLDRGRWYVVGMALKAPDQQRLWRADRVLNVRTGTLVASTDDAFDVRMLLGRKWLAEAMATWATYAPVKIRLTRAQANRLQEDWYYRHAQFEDVDDGAVLMTFGEAERALVFELLRWLGPGAELIEPTAWREAFRDELVQMLGAYGKEPQGDHHS